MSVKKIDYYYPGDIIYAGKPFVVCIQKSVQKHICGHCLSRRGPLKFCGCCRVTRYCSRSCQKEDWNDHRLECKFLKNLPDDDSKAFIQFLGKVIMKVKDKDWTLITERIGNKVVSFADLITHTDALDSHPKLKLLFKEVASKVKEYIGEENIPQEDKLFEIIGKVKFNSFTSRIPLNTCGFDIPVLYADGFADLRSLFIGLSKLNHSCIPNTYFAHDGSISKLFAIKKIRKDEELTVNYFPMVFQIYSKTFAESLKEFFLGHCKCNDCSLPYGTSILTKVIDETKAHTVIKYSESTLELCSTFSRLQVSEPKIWLFLREEVKILLKEQEGVLGNTNILRLRLLAWKCLHVKGPPEEQLEDLEKLAEYVELAFGENYRELQLVYSSLIDVSRLLLDYTKIVHYTEKLSRLQRIFCGDDLILDTRKLMALLLQGV